MMQNRLISTFIALTLFLCAAERVRAAGVHWAATYTDAAATARKADRPILLFLTTDWSGWGRKMETETLADAKVAALTEKFVAFRADAEKTDVEQAKRYAVSTFPTLLALNADGKIIGKIVGYETADVFAGHLADWLRAYKAVPALEAALARNRKDGETAAKLASYAAAQGDAERTTALLEIAENNGAGNADLPATYNAVADIYQERQDYAKAIALFKKAIAAGKDPKSLAYARISIGVCYLEQGKNAEAVPEFRATIAIPNAPADLKKQALEFLERLQNEP